MEIEIKRMVAYLEGFLKVSHHPHITLLSRGLTRSPEKKHYVSTTRMLMATKVCRIVIYLNRLLPMKPHNPLIA